MLSGGVLDVIPGFFCPSRCIDARLESMLNVSFFCCFSLARSFTLLID